MHDTIQGAGSPSWSARIANAFRAASEAPWLPFAAVLIAFGVDLITPRATAESYVIAIFTTLRARSPRVPLYTAALCTPCIVIGYFLAPSWATPTPVVLINRAFMLLLLWVGAPLIATMIKGRAALSEAQAKAWSSERRFRLMADGVPAMIWVTDAEGRIEFVNREYRTFFGVTQEQVRQNGWQPLVHPDDAETYVGVYFGALANKAPFHARARVRHASGEWRWVESSGLPRLSGTGEFLGHVGFSPDVTSMIEAEQALQDADRRKNEFLATLSHELRNPLAPLRNAAKIIATPGVTAELFQRASGIIRRQTEHMSRLLDDLLELARITQGKLKVDLRPVSLAGVIDAAIEAARPALESKNHRLSVALPTEATTLRADPVRLSQVFSNLLTNAAKYTDPGGEIELTGRIEGRSLRVAVKDNGIGLSQEALAHIFTMFSQVEDARGRAEGGMGIGLALAKGLVELQGGTLEVRSEGPGRGSEFIVCLPLPAEGLGAEPSPEGENAAANGDSRRVLVADDNQDTADSLAAILTLAGHEVRVAHDGLTAVSIAQAFRPEVALLDIGMPGLDGYAVASALRKQSGGRDIFLIALTGWGQEEDIRQAQSAGFDTHLTKPVDPDRIRSLVSEGKRSATMRSESPSASGQTTIPN